MNAVEIEEAVSALAAAPFDPAEFAYSFLTAFGMKDTTIKRLRSGQSNVSDIAGGVLQRNNIHIAVSDSQDVVRALAALRDSPRTASAKAKFLLATDGKSVEAEDLVSGEVLSCQFTELGDHFGFFLGLAGITTVREIKNNPIDPPPLNWSTLRVGMFLQGGSRWQGSATSPRRLSRSCGRSMCCCRRGQSTAEAVRQIGVTETTYFRWRREFGGLKTDQVKRLKDLEAENARLRRAVSDLTLDKMILAEAAKGNF